MNFEVLTGPRAANRINKVLGQLAQIHQITRFPVDVQKVALGCHDFFAWRDPITEVRAAPIPGFEGALFPNDEKTKWLLLFNDSLNSPGRVRFTQAHELGHYILHRQLQDTFECTDAGDMHNLSNQERGLEQQADEFASFLLMPLDDFRNQVGSEIDLEVFSHCAARYGVSLTAAALKWLSQTSQKAVLVLSNDGFINWAWSSDAALKSGAFFRTRSAVNEVPVGSLAADSSTPHDRKGKNVPMTVWFPHADSGLALREMKISSEQYGTVLSLLVLPSIADVWGPRCYG